MYKCQARRTSKKKAKVLSLKIFPGGSDGKESAFSAGYLGSVPGSRRSPGAGNTQYSCLENFMDRGAWQPTVHKVKESQTRRKD